MMLLLLLLLLLLLKEPVYSFYISICMQSRVFKENLNIFKQIQCFILSADQFLRLKQKNIYQKYFHKIFFFFNIPVEACPSLNSYRLYKLTMLMLTKVISLMQK